MSPSSNLSQNICPAQYNVLYQDALSPEQRAQFDTLATMIRNRSGLHLPPEKAGRILPRIAKRMRDLQLDNLSEYIELISAPGTTEEWDNLISALTTNVTSFFRENHHFEYFTVNQLPGLTARARAGGRVRIWSSACSSGQEAYSLAMIIAEAMPDFAEYDMRILASDIDRPILSIARSGHYPADIAAPLSEERRKRFLIKDESGVTVSDELKSMVSIRHLNLIQDWPMSGKFDAIFCRNVLIYFNQSTQNRLIRRFADVCAPGGVLYLGHSERIESPAELGFRQVAQTTFAYQAPQPRQSPPPATIGTY